MNAPIDARQPTDTALVPESLDVLIIGAGISGIGAAVHLKERCPDWSFGLVDRRQRVGGTWDLFRYPGVRSDSDMYTLGFRFKPWTDAKAIADGPSIRAYLEETVAEHDLARSIYFDHKVVQASWSSADARWTVSMTVGPEKAPQTVRARFIFMCGGYYNYDAGYLPEFAGRDDFLGQLVHPQHWPDNLDYSGKRVVVIGSGATAVTLVPAMAEQGAAHVTMLQRSPTYVVSRPAEDAFATKARAILPEKAAYAVIRWKNVLQGAFFYKLSKTKPDKVKAKILEGVRAELGPDFDVETHFTPRYNPWDQRVCLVPDGDLFKALKNGSASVVTGTIDRFTATGIRLTSGEEISADIIVTATGLNLQMLGGMQTIVDGQPVSAGEAMLHKGVMLSGIPNLAMWFGYTNASWTLKADLTSEYVCRILRHLDDTNTTMVTARLDGDVGEDTFVDFTSGYFQRAQGLLPKQGTALPWRLHQNYLKDLRLLRRGSVADPALHFERHRGHARAGQAADGGAHEQLLVGIDA